MGPQPVAAPSQPDLGTMVPREAGLEKSQGQGWSHAGFDDDLEAMIPALQD